MKRPLPHQLIQVPPGWAMPPPLMPQPPARPQEPPPEPQPVPEPRTRRRRFRPPRVLREDSFWTGALTALCIGGLLMAIIAAS
ncbi:hypothetical protein ABZT04_30030 [Streptomyces sp. NPDC005492]|uniref:hypothetical protein n=1 Tax=Streptomyces sp. NPDC005492 TaxID=3156883 RepID=UPI0033A32044